MGTIRVKDGTEIFYKDWGTGKPILFHHGWPLSADDWDAQMMFFLEKGFRVIAHDCIAVFSETDFTEDLRKIDIPLLVMHGDDDQIVPIADSALLSSKLAPMATLKVYPGLPHGMATTHPEIINQELLAFIQGEQATVGQVAPQAERIPVQAS